MLTALRALVVKDLRLFVHDRRALIMAFVAPIAIASFFGSIFPGGDAGGERAKVRVALVNDDDSAVALGIVARATADAALDVSAATAERARRDVREGQTAVAVVIPRGFGAASMRALLGMGERPQIAFWFDPSRGTELMLVRGVMVGHVMEAVSQEAFGGPSGQQLLEETAAALDSPAAQALPRAQRELLLQLLTTSRALNSSTGGRTAGLTIPYSSVEEAVTSGVNVTYNGYAHAFAGMAVQFLLFAAIDLGIGILLERQRGLWKRLRAAPLSRFTLLTGKALSAILIALSTLCVSFAFAMVVFDVRITGSSVGFALVAISCAAMASAFGLLIASLGATPGGARGVASLSVLLMVMLGGAWVPTFVFPAWLQRLTVVVPTRWAVDGFDAMTWRGLGLRAALEPSAVLLGFALVFGAVAWSRFSWDEA